MKWFEDKIKEFNLTKIDKVFKVDKYTVTCYLGVSNGKPFYWVFCNELEGVFSEANSLVECIPIIKDAIDVMERYLKENQNDK